MLRSLANVRTFLLAIFMIMAGSGFLSTLIAVRLELAGTPAPLIGLVGTAYFAGLTVGSLRIGRLVAEVGHIRSIAAFIADKYTCCVFGGVIPSPSPQNAGD